MAKSRQIAALPVRRNPDGTLGVLLVTSRETRRWVVPKGWPWPELDDPDAAVAEAREEAGVVGRVRPESIGSFSYGKRLAHGVVEVRVAVYLLEVQEELESWPEQHQRQRAWFTVEGAAMAVDEPELRALIRQLESVA